MKIIQHIAIITILIVGLASCSEYSKTPGKVYMPDMSYSRAYEFYSYNPNYKNGITAQAPVKGTIARGAMMPDHLLEDDTNGYKGLKYSGPLSMAQIEEGGRLYNIHCGVCHGNELNGNGPLYAGGAGKYPAAPANFKDAKYLNMPVGTMYHAIMYGKNLMGAYSSQLDGKQRWMVLAYIKKVQGENGGGSLTNSFAVSDAPVVADTTKKGADTKTTSAMQVMASTGNVAKTDVKATAKEAIKTEAKAAH
jgi:mono/diheme cytochrome c family protein